MKYTIHGYSQEQSIKNGLDYLDLGILRWIQDFYPAMKKTIFQNKEYGWFSYSYFLNELPIIGINTKAGLRKRIDKIIEKGFIERVCIKDTEDKLGTRSWVRLTEKIIDIISNTTVATGGNSSCYPVETPVATGGNSSCYNSSIKYSSIKNPSISKDTASGFSQSSYSEIPNNSATKENLVVHYEKDFEDFYEAFEGKHPSKQPKRANAVYSKWKVAIKTHPPEAILKAIECYADYLSVATWRKQKDIIAWLNGAMYEVDWKQETLQEQQKSNKTTFNKQDAKPTLREAIDTNRNAIKSINIDKYF